MADYSTPAGDPSITPAAAAGSAAVPGFISVWVAGLRYALSLAGNFNIGGIFIGSAVDGLTALAGGGQAGATPITKSINRFTTCATIADSGLLLPAKAGMGLAVINSGATSMNVFPATGETINALSANAAFAVAAGKTAEFVSAIDGKWHAILSA